MMFVKARAHYVLPLFLGFALAAIPACAQGDSANGKLKIHVHPKQAYVFVDGKAIRDGSQSIHLTPGEHQVSVRNYGYLPNTQQVSIDSRKTTRIKVALEKSGDKVAGPFGDIELKGHPRAAVLLNGDTPDYFVGHVDEFDWNWIWHQRLLVHPGTYQVTVTREGNTIWSGPVNVKAGQQVTVYLNRNGKMKTKEWARGEKMGPQPRFHAGIASATVPVAPVTAELSAQSNPLNCGQSAQLDWRSADAAAVSISNLGNVPLSGERTVNPMKTTAYELVAKGPGGEATRTATVDINGEPMATLTLSAPEVHFHKIGDKVVEDGPDTLQWSVSNADRVTITPLGSQAMSGSRTIEPVPAQTSTGPVNEMVDYTLSAANACGGTTTRTAAVHVVGSIDPAPPVTLASVFYPTNYPTARRPKIGLVATEKEALAEAANRFKSHEEYDNDNASLMIVGYADIRGPKTYNLKLSARRARLVKNYLVSQGIPADKIKSRAEGKRRELSAKQVAMLQRKDAEKPEKWMMSHAQDTWLAYNRRVDIILEPAGQQSAKAFPNDASDARVLWQRAQPGIRKVETASSAANTSAALH